MSAWLHMASRSSLFSCAECNAPIGSPTWQLFALPADTRVLERSSRRCG